MLTILYDPAATGYWQPMHPERPERLIRSEAYLRDRHPDWIWRKPSAASDAAVLAVHSARHVARLAEGADFDVDTPCYDGIEKYARCSAGAAIEAAEKGQRNEKTFSLMRPPGHHAMRDRAMGFCYLNSIVIAAFHALKTGCHRIGIWDFDAHHGNGTEALVRGHQQIRFASIHQFPGYPGTGSNSAENIFNWPIAPGTDPEVHARQVEQALEKLVEFRPELLLVSAGFDAFVGDPLTEMTLQPVHFERFGAWLGSSGVPGAALLEGGYSDELPVLIDAFLSGWEA
jgi:acetoin utilization deacetylase AcuC-like enzyme